MGDLTRHHRADALREMVEVKWLGDHFHARLQKALRERDPTAEAEAKLALVRSKTAYRKPFYWGPFELYAGAP